MTHKDFWLDGNEIDKAQASEVCHLCGQALTPGANVLENLYGDIVCDEACKETYDEDEAERRQQLSVAQF